MSLFQQAACLNNEGVLALQHGDCDSAINAMGKSIHLLKFELSRMRLKQNIRGGTTTGAAGSCCWKDSFGATTNSPRSNFNSRILQRMRTIDIPSPSRELSPDTMIFHSQAVIIPAMDASSPPSDDSEMNIYTGSVLYNVALTHHWAATTACTNECCDCDGVSTSKTTRLEQAKKLYMMALQLLDSHPSKLLDVRTALIVKLACINNLSQIRYSMGEYQTAQEGLDYISWFIRHHSSLSNHHRAIFEEEPSIQSMLLNVLFLKPPVVASAA